MIKKALVVSSFLIALFGLGACSAMPDGQAGAPDAVASAEKLRVLMVDPNAAGLNALLADSLSYGHSGGKLDTKTSFVADLLSGASDFVTIEITGQTVSRSKDITVIRHTLTAQTNDSGKPGNVKINILQVWQLQDGAWKLLARQAIRVA
jgi:Domain of unknown function (DUF4440)